MNAHPDRSILATNGGTYPNWTKGGESFIAQTEEQVRSGRYPIMGEYEFRHYMSFRQRKERRRDRDVKVPIDGANGAVLTGFAKWRSEPAIPPLSPETGPPHSRTAPTAPARPRSSPHRARASC